MINKTATILAILTFNIILSDSMNFVGDMMFGRRYYCTGANSYNDDNQDLEDNLCPMPEGFCDGFGSTGIIPNCGYDVLLNGIIPYFQNSYAINVGNLEAVITDSTSTPHPGFESCKIVFHSCPEILENMDAVGFNYLNLGNNHVLDYMQPGIINTQNYLNDYNINHGGAGLNDTIACAPSYMNTDGYNFAFLASSDIDGEDAGDSCEPTLEASSESAGFCSLNEENISSQILETLNNENDAIIIYQMHTGYEYDFEPNESDRFMNHNPPQNPFKLGLSERSIEMAHYAIDEGADIVIQHHPHVLQGLELYNDKLIAHSLGNFIFDQNFPETWSSMILNTNYNESGFYNHTITPVYLHYYLPQIASGKLANHILDYIAMQSRKLNTFVKVNRNSHTAEVVFNEPNYTSSKDTTIILSNNEDEEYISDPIKLDKFNHISSIASNNSIEYRVGREIIWMGDFDFNPEIDDCINKNTHYWLQRSSSIIDSVSYNGTSSIVMTRTDANSENGLVDNYYCYPLVSDPSDITIRGFIKTNNAEDAMIGVRFYESRCSNAIGTEYTNPIDGDSDWTEKYQNISVPEDAEYIDLRMVSFPPESGESTTYFDNVGLIEWEDWKGGGEEVLLPNDYYYYQVRSNQEEIQITINEKSYYYNEPFILGDTNSDNQINIVDVVRIVNFALGIYSPSDLEFISSDMNQDDAIDLLDVVILINVILES